MKIVLSLLHELVLLSISKVKYEIAHHSLSHLYILTIRHRYTASSKSKETVNTMNYRLRLGLK